MKDCSVSQEYSDLSNEELVILAQKGESTALAFLARRFLKINRAKYPAGYLEIEDLNQEGMLGFLSAVRTYSPDKEASFDTYASKCINNRIKSVAGRTIKKASEKFVVDNQASDRYNPLTAVSENERIDELIEILSSMLSEKEKKVFVMYISGFKPADIAKNLGLCEKSIDNALQRAKRKLKKYYNDAL